MKIKKDNVSIIKYLLYFIFLLDICFWYIFPIETSFTGVYNKKLITIIIFALAILLLVGSGFFWKKSFKFILLFSFVFVIDVIALTLYSYIEYPKQGISGTLAMAYYYFGYLIVFPILYVFIKDGENNFLETLNVFAVILIVLLLLQSIIYSISGTIILQGIVNSEDVTLRNNRIRIGMMFLGNFSVIYNFYKLLDRKTQKKKPFYALSFIMGILCVFLVQQTRMYEVAIVGALLAVYISSSKRSKRVIRIAIIIFAGFCIVAFSDVLDSFISSFAVEGEYGAGTRVRFEAIEYFLTYVKKNPLFAMGFVHQDYYSSILYGSDGKYYLSDVGIIGLLTEGGLGMVILYLIFCFRMIYIIKKLKGQNNSLLIGLCVFVILCTPTLIIWGRRTILYIGFLMAYFEYKYYSYNLNKRKSLI